MGTGENEQALRKIIDFVRFLSILILILHFYQVWILTQETLGFENRIIERLVLKIFSLPLFSSVWAPKLLSLTFLATYIWFVKKTQPIKGEPKLLLFTLFVGNSFYFGSYIIIDANPWIYIAITFLGYIFILIAGIHLLKTAKRKLTKDIFNKENETFPQEERKLENEFSINLAAKYWYKKRYHPSWINIINPFRGTLVMGTPGAGKSYFVIRHIITQHINKGFSMFLYDFKYDDLTRIAYNTLLKAKTPNKPRFYIINFEDLNHTHRCNPLQPSSLNEITDAMEASRTMMLGLNREWIKKQGDFFVESSINFLTAIIWFLKKHEGGVYCTLPHAIELMQTDYSILFELLSKEQEIEALISPFISAWKNEAFDQLEGQVASTKVSLARLSSPVLYYVLTGDDFTLDLNNPDDPKIICVGNNPQKQQVYGAVLSLYISRVLKLVNQKNKQKCSLVFDEFPTIYINNMDSLLATARSNKVATTLAVQDFSQLRKDYGKEQADVILNIMGNVISGQVSGDTAKYLTERFGKINQTKQSIAVNKNDTTVSDSTAFDFAIPASKISSLSSGEFVGMVADEPSQKIELKLFNNEILNDHTGIKKEESNYKEIPLIRQVNNSDIENNYLQIKQDIQEIIATTEIISIEKQSDLKTNSLKIDEMEY